MTRSQERYLTSFGASKATIFSKRGSPRNESHCGWSLRPAMSRYFRLLGGFFAAETAASTGGARKFLGHFGIAEVLRVEIDDGDAHTMFHFALAEVMQMRLPMPVLRQIFGDTLG